MGILYEKKTLSQIWHLILIHMDFIFVFYFVFRTHFFHFFSISSWPLTTPKTWTIMDDAPYIFPQHCINSHIYVHVHTRTIRQNDVDAHRHSVEQFGIIFFRFCLVINSVSWCFNLRSPIYQMVSPTTMDSGELESERAWTKITHTKSNYGWFFRNFLRCLNSSTDE